MKTLDERLQTAWALLSAAAGKSDKLFWATFDEIEAQVLDGLDGPDLAQAIQTLDAYLAKLKGFNSVDRRPLHLPDP